MILVIRKKTALICLSTALLILLAAFTLAHQQKNIQPANAPLSDAITLPIIMYHSVLKDPGSQGVYVISPDVFAADMEYLRDHGYASIFVSELVAYVYEDAPLPQKPVIISFDDGNLNNLTYIVPLLQEYEMKAVISVVGKFVERAITEGDHHPAYSYLTWDEISKLVDSGRVEIGNHTYALHEQKNGRRGATPQPGESVEQYQQVLCADLQKLQHSLEENCGVTPIVFAYPYGFIHQASLAVIKELGFKASFSCSEKVNYITKDADSLFCLGRYNRPSGISSEAFMKNITD